MPYFNSVRNTIVIQLLLQAVAVYCGSFGGAGQCPPIEHGLNCGWKGQSPSTCWDDRDCDYYPGWKCCQHGCSGRHCTYVQQVYDDPCSPNPCQNGGECKREKYQNKDYRCYCRSGYEGCDCQIKTVKKECPAGFTYIHEGNYCYALNLAEGSWDYHLKMCRSVGEKGNLAIVNTQELHNAIFEKLIKNWAYYLKGRFFYLGARRRQGTCDNPFHWICYDNTPKPVEYCQWAYRQPDNCYTSAKEECLMVKVTSSGLPMYDGDCYPDEKSPYKVSSICQTEPLETYVHY